MKNKYLTIVLITIITGILSYNSISKPITEVIGNIIIFTITFYFFTLYKKINKNSKCEILILRKELEEIQKEQREDEYFLSKYYQQKPFYSEETLRNILKKIYPEVAYNELFFSKNFNECITALTKRKGKQVSIEDSAKKIGISLLTHFLSLPRRYVINTFGIGESLVSTANKRLLENDCFIPMFSPERIFREKFRKNKMIYQLYDFKITINSEEKFNISYHKNESHFVVTIITPLYINHIRVHHGRNVEKTIKTTINLLMGRQKY